MNKKGFTLVELILVIVLVGLLTIIASTVIYGRINKAKKDSAQKNAISYINAINDYNFISEGEDIITSGDISTITPKLNESLDGTKPDSGSVVINTTTKKVTSAELHYDNYTVTYNGSSYTTVKN